MGGMGCKVCYDTPCTCPKRLDTDELEFVRKRLAADCEPSIRDAMRLLATVDFMKQALQDSLAAAGTICGHLVGGNRPLTTTCRDDSDNPCDWCSACAIAWAIEEMS